MGQALYRKYRSKSLSEIVGQEHVTATLARAIKDGKISHAYLLTGPRGVGKTSIARILAHEVNGLPYTDESIHLDIIEIDAASNRRIDEIRDLRDKVHIAPTSAKYKVYIIDEVHMLTKEAFNALLKTLEEPPAHVIFILATTEAHKLPETIVSRTQRFTFKAIAHDKAVEHLRNIAIKEKMKIDDAALDLLAEHGRGSFRDAIGLLDQVGHSHEHVTRSDVEQMIGIAPADTIKALLDATLSGNPSEIVASLEVFVEQGIAPAQIAKQLAALLRQQLLEGRALLTREQVTDVLSELLSVQASQESSTSLELTLFGVARAGDEKLVNTTGVSVKTKQPDILIKEEEPSTETKVVSIGKDQKPAQISSAEQVEFKNPEDISGWWPELINNVKKHNNTLYGVLRMAHPELEGDTLRLSFGFGLHSKKVADAGVNGKLQDIIKSLTNRDLIVQAVHNKELKGVAQQIADRPSAVAPDNLTSKKPTQDFNAVNAIFGGGEVLES
ncbi:DNA polymerase III subunit gamma/tau [soil metagenome]